jgi:hypothetical protein
MWGAPSTQQNVEPPQEIHHRLRALVQRDDLCELHNSWDSPEPDNAAPRQKEQLARTAAGCPSHGSEQSG